LLSNQRLGRVGSLLAGLLDLLIKGDDLRKAFGGGNSQVIRSFRKFDPKQFLIDFTEDTSLPQMGSLQSLLSSKLPTTPLKVSARVSINRFLFVASNGSDQEFLKSFAAKYRVIVLRSL